MTVRTGRLRLSLAEKAVFLYFLATYLPQFIFHLVSEETLRERYRFEPDSQVFAVFILLLLVLVYLLQRLLPPIAVRPGIVGVWLGRMFDSRLNTFLAVALALLAINFALTEGIEFRQSGDQVSQSGLAVTALLFLKPYMYAWLIYQFLRVMRGEEQHTGRLRMQAAIFLAALVLSITGSLEVVPIVWMALFVVLGPRALRRVFLITNTGAPVWKKVLLVVVGVPLAAIVAASIIAVGWINKAGVEGVERVVDELGVGHIVSYTVVRMASSYSSAISFATENLGNLAIYSDVVKLPAENVAYRLSLFSDDPLPRPEITQLTRLNYLNYEWDTSLARAGASPGLVGSAFYSGPFPLGFLLIALYIIFLIRLFDLPLRGLGDAPRITVPIFMLSFMYTMFESPIDYLIFVDPATGQFLLILSAFVAASVARRSRAAQPTRTDRVQSVAAA